MADRPPLPSIDIVNFQGLFTKQNPEMLDPVNLRECINADFFQEYGSLTKIRGNRRVLTQQYSENSTVKGIFWGAGYKAQDLSGAIDRQVLIGAGTTIRKVNTDGTTTSLLTGEPDELFRTSDQLDRFLYITSQDPLDVGQRGQMSKYDGTRITQWGLTPPGDQQTTILSFDDSSIFTTSNSTVATSAQPAWEGNSTAMTKGTASTASSIEILAQTPVSINNEIPDRCQMQVFIPRADYRKLATSGRAISIYMGSGFDLSSDYYRFDFQIGRLIEGWNTLVIDFSTFPTGDFGVTVGSPDDTAIDSYRFEVITNNASDTLTVNWDALVNLDQGAPIPTFTDPGGTVFNESASSVWSYRVTFIDDNGLESNAGPVSVNADNTTGSTNFGSITLSGIPISSNPSVIQRNLYRTTANGADYLFLDVINDNITTTYVDTTPDISLSTTTPPELGQLINDNSPPPSAGIVLIWKRTAFLAGDPLSPSTLYFSRDDNPSAFPSVNTFEFDERITGMYPTSVGIVITTETAYWRIIGDNPDYTPDKIFNGYGGVGPRATGVARDMGWAVDRDGMRLYNMSGSPLKVSEVIRDRVDAFSKTNLDKTHTVHSRKDNAILWFTQNSDGNYTDLYMYQYFIDDASKGAFTQLQLNPTSLNVLHLWEIEDSLGEHHLYGGTSGGQVMEFMASGQFNCVNDTGQVRPLTMEIQTPFIRAGSRQEAKESAYISGQGMGVSGRIVPRFIELRIKENTGAAHTWTVTVDTSDSASENAEVRDSQDITFDFQAGQSLMRLPTRDLTPAEYFRFTIVNSELNKDLQIMGVKIYYSVRPSQFMVTGASGYATTGSGAAGAGGQN